MANLCATERDKSSEVGPYLRASRGGSGRRRRMGRMTRSSRKQAPQPEHEDEESECCGERAENHPHHENAVRREAIVEDALVMCLHLSLDGAARVDCHESRAIGAVKRVLRAGCEHQRQEHHHGGVPLRRAINVFVVTAVSSATAERFSGRIETSSMTEAYARSAAMRQAARSAASAPPWS